MPVASSLLAAFSRAALFVCSAEVDCLMKDVVDGGIRENKTFILLLRAFKLGLV